jgi:endonuclease G
MGRIDTFRQIDRDSSLKEEILDKIAGDSALGERLGLATVEGIAGEPGLESMRSTAAKAPVDTARELIENPPEIPTDFGLEAIIKVMARPVLLVRNDDYDLAELETETWRDRLKQARPSLAVPIRSVGRIEVDNSPQFDWVGTGWVVADDVIVTNRHVASVFAHRVGDKFGFRTSFLGPMGARLDFAEELGADTPAEFRLVDVLHIEDRPGPDMAFLRVDWTSNEAAERRTPIRLAPADSPFHNVVVIGYPAKDTRTTIPDEMDRIFGDVYNVKRLAPGDVTNVLELGQIVTHDCTTLGGNSGSALIDIETGEAVALHFAGKEKQHNYAVAASVVARRLEQIESTHSVPGPLVSATAKDLEPEPTID